MNEKKQENGLSEKGKKIAIGVAVAVIVVCLAVLISLQRSRTDVEEQTQFSPESNGVEVGMEGMLYVPKVKFKNKSGTDVELAITSDCQNCDAPEFLSIRRSSDGKENRIPAPQEHNTADPGSALLRTTVVYGACSDEVVVYGESILPTSMSEDVTPEDPAEAVKTNDPDEVPPSYSKWITTVPASGEILIRNENLSKDEFEKVWTTPPAGCQSFHQKGALVIGD